MKFNFNFELEFYYVSDIFHASGISDTTQGNLILLVCNILEFSEFVSFLDSWYELLMCYCCYSSCYSSKGFVV